MRCALIHERMRSRSRTSKRDNNGRNDLVKQKIILGSLKIHHRIIYINNILPQFRVKDYLFSTEEYSMTKSSSNRANAFVERFKTRHPGVFRPCVWVE